MSKHRTRTTRWNRLLSGVLCLALVLGLLPAAGLVQTAEASWADPYGKQLVEWGVMNPSSNLRLGDTITRAEFVAMCNRAFGYNKLGGTPFIDVPASRWYAQDIDIAYNAGYFKGTSSNKASPNKTLTREQAAVLIARNLMLQETVGESLGFTDSRELSKWSRGLVGAAVAEGMISGYTDGSFRPDKNITRGEVAAMLVRVIGNPINKAGNHELGDVYGNVVISKTNVTLRNTVILGNLYITGGVDLGSVLLENVTVLGRIVVSGGGVSDAAKSSVILRNVVADELVVDSLTDRFVTVSAYGLTDIGKTYVRSNCYLEDSCSAGYGLHYIEQDGATLLQLAGSIKEVRNMTPYSELRLVQGTAERITIDEYARNSQLVVGTGTRIDELNLDVATLVTGDGIGEGDIIDLNIAAEGCEVDILPEHVNIRPGITATVAGEVINSEGAAELSSEPRLMAGYPKVTNLQPAKADGLYSGNKPGTIYWAVSAIADGSVSVEDLLAPPVYGGNILKFEDKLQADNIPVKAKAEFARPIAGLEPDGSYYISAVLVDERGNRSPLKVVSFTTPDDTQPAFVDGYPYMSRVSCEVAQVTAMANKSCKLYWVLLPHGASKPTAQNFRSGSFGGSYGDGSQSVVKNVPVSITVNSAQLQENTDYDLYLWLNDFDGAMCSEVYHVLNADTKKDTDPSFTTPDETAPVVTNIMQTNFELENAIEFIFAIDEMPSTLYWAVVPEADTTFIKADDDLNGLRVQLKMESGTGAIVSGHKDSAGANADTQVTAGSGVSNFNPKLDPAKYGHNFKMYYMAKDATGNCSEVRYIVIHTKDSEEPTVTQRFSDALYNSEADKKAGLNPRPQAGSDIMLVFSEQVKGDSDIDADTFVDFYNEVKYYQDLIDAGDDNNANKSGLATAKNRLAAELKKHITLYYVQTSSGKRTTKALDTDKSHDYGWIDWSEAIVELQSDGAVILTLPSGTAVSLGGGMEYYFHFENIYDDSYTANRLAYKDPKTGEILSGGGLEKACDLPSFTTVYAQVWLSPDETGISEVEAKVADPDSGGYKENTEKIPLDIVFNVDPQSTSNTASTVVWDMVIWSKKTAFVSAKFEVYRRMGDGTDNGWGGWEQVTGEADIPGSGLPAVSLNANKLPAYYAQGNTDDLGTDELGNSAVYQHRQYDNVTDGLKEGRVYQYGIRFTSVNGSTERKAWTSLVTLQVSLVAGALGNVQNLDSNNVDASYTDLVYTRGLLNEIGSVDLGSSTGTILEVEKQFKDERIPSFSGTYPTFESTANTITMQLTLDHAGTVYYVVAPADGTITTSIKEGTKVTEITAKNDGRGVDEDENGNKKEYTNDTARKSAVDQYFAGQSGIDKKTYIPIGGTDRDNCAEYIYYMPTAGGDEDTRGKYYAPTYGDIFDGKNKYASDGDVRTGSVTYVSTRKTEEITQLSPNTWYYVYVVLQSDGGALDNVVQIYRVKTEPASPPIITISASALTANMMTYDGADLTASSASRQRVDSELTYALVNWSNLPDFFKTKFSWTVTNGTTTTATYTDVTLINMLITRTGSSNNSPTLFDAYADIATTGTGTGARKAESYKDELMTYIRNGGTYTGEQRPLDFGTMNYSASGNAVSPKFKNVPEDNTEVEYGVLVFARVYGAGDGIENYGFAAAQGMYVPDPIPPVFVPQTTPNKNGMSYVIVSGLKAINPATKNEVAAWRTVAKNDPNTLYSYTFSGKITISFTKPLYQYITRTSGTVRRAVVAGGDKDDDTQVSFKNAASAPEGVTLKLTGNANAAQSVFEISFEGMQWNQSITVLGSGRITNSSPTGQVSNYRLTLRFDPTLTNKTIYGYTDKDSFVEMIEGGFVATWAEMP